MAYLKQFCQFQLGDRIYIFLKYTGTISSIYHNWCLRLVFLALAEIIGCLCSGDFSLDFELDDDLCLLSFFRWPAELRWWPVSCWLTAESVLLPNRVLGWLWSTERWMLAVIRPCHSCCSGAKNCSRSPLKFSDCQKTKTTGRLLVLTWSRWYWWHYWTAVWFGNWTFWVCFSSTSCFGHRGIWFGDFLFYFSRKCNFVIFSKILHSENN